ncbi:conjugal transfer protein TraX [Morganella psychrotolerans]|uniref:conjugal transfer protein TraX n=1 Tax=Morganella psychrotolerans TaxID=368603 RepID=UPI0039AFC381
MTNQNQPGHGRNKSLGRKVAGVGWAILNPFSDIKILYRQCITSPLQHLNRIKILFRGNKDQPHELTWEQAVANTERSVEELIRNHGHLRKIWWLFMMITGCLSTVLIILLLISFRDLPEVTIQRAAVTTFILMQLTAIGFVKALLFTYRLWQLTENRVSKEEKGRFSHFIAEAAWCKQTLFLN